MKIEIEKVLEEQKSVLRQMMELYTYDFSEFTDDDINEYGFYGYSHFDQYWTDADRHPFFIKVDNKLAGLVLVFSHCYYLKGDNIYSIAEFFVLKKYRNKHIGKISAHKIFDKFIGRWEINQHPKNIIAQNFWEKTIDDYTKGQYKIHQSITEDWIGTGFNFDNQL